MGHCLIPLDPWLETICLAGCYAKRRNMTVQEILRRTRLTLNKRAPENQVQTFEWESLYNKVFNGKTRKIG